MPTLFAYVKLIHGFWRWAVLLVAVIALVKFLIGWFGNKKVESGDKSLALAFAGVMTVQFVLGLINVLGLIVLGGFSMRIHPEHILYGLIATGLAHGLPIRKDGRPDASRFRTASIMILVSLVLIAFSVIRLRGSFFYGIG